MLWFIVNNTLINILYAFMLLEQKKEIKL